MGSTHGAGGVSCILTRPGAHLSSLLAALTCRVAATARSARCHTLVAVLHTATASAARRRGAGGSTLCCRRPGLRTSGVGAQRAHDVVVGERKGREGISKDEEESLSDPETVVGEG